MNRAALTVGGALGTEVAASVLASHTGLHGMPAERGFTVSFWIGAIGLAASFLASLAIPAMAVRRGHGNHTPGRASASQLPAQQGKAR